MRQCCKRPFLESGKQPVHSKYWWDGCANRLRGEWPQLRWKPEIEGSLHQINQQGKRVQIPDSPHHTHTHTHQDRETHQREKCKHSRDPQFPDAEAETDRLSFLSEATQPGLRFKPQSTSVCSYPLLYTCSKCCLTPHKSETHRGRRVPDIRPVDKGSDHHGKIPALETFCKVWLSMQTAESSWLHS